MAAPGASSAPLEHRLALNRPDLASDADPMETRNGIRIAVHAPARAFADGARTGLGRLGYALLGARSLGDDPIAAQIVDDRWIERATLAPGRPLILLTGRGSEPGADPAAVARIPRRAGLGDLYLALQDALEERPRSVPRIADAIPARCRRGERTWIGAIRSISERGCLLQSSGDIETDLRVELSFPLQPGGWIQVPAQARYRSDEGIGIVFRPSGAQARSALRSYVARRLTA